VLTVLGFLTLKNLYHPSIFLNMKTSLKWKLKLNVHPKKQKRPSKSRETIPLNISYLKTLLLQKGMTEGEIWAES
jgi:hypothetical protein